MYVLCVLYGWLSDQQMHNIYNWQYFIYRKHSPTCFDASTSSSVLSFYCAKVTKIIKVTNSIKSVDYNVYVIISDDIIVYNMLWDVNLQVKYMEIVYIQSGLSYKCHLYVEVSCKQVWWEANRE